MDAKRKEILDDLGKTIMSEVRDETCSFLQRVIAGRMRDKVSKELYKRYKTLDDESAEVLHRFLASAVDACLASFLNYLDVHEIPLPVRTRDGETVDARALSDGLVGELYSDRGWLALFSEFHDRVDPRAG